LRKGKGRKEQEQGKASQFTMTTVSTLPLPLPLPADAPAPDLCAPSSDSARPRVVAAVLASDVHALEEALWEVARDEIARAAAAAAAVSSSSAAGSGADKSDGGGDGGGGGGASGPPRARTPPSPSPSSVPPASIRRAVLGALDGRALLAPGDVGALVRQLAPRALSGEWQAQLLLGVVLCFC